MSLPHFILYSFGQKWLGSGCEGARWGRDWKPNFSGKFNDWELVEVENFLWRKLHSLPIRREEEDKLSRNEIKHGNFSVRSLYACLTMGDWKPFPKGVVWSTWAPMKVGFFTREATWGKILTLDQPKGGDGICQIGVFCTKVKRKQWTICYFTVPKLECWGNWYSLFGEVWVMHSYVKENLLGWHESFAGKKQKKKKKLGELLHCTCFRLLAS